MPVLGLGKVHLRTDTMDRKYEMNADQFTTFLRFAGPVSEVRITRGTYEFTVQNEYFGKIDQIASFFQKPPAQSLMEKVAVGSLPKTCSKVLEKTGNGGEIIKNYLAITARSHSIRYEPTYYGEAIDVAVSDVGCIKRVFPPTVKRHQLERRYMYNDGKVRGAPYQ